MSEFLEIVSSPGHWGFETVSNAAFALPAYFVGRWRLRVHDRKEHGAG